MTQSLAERDWPEWRHLRVVNNSPGPIGRGIDRNLQGRIVVVLPQ
ncbi:hypothetical protein HDF16_003102 [Granulicella aggregans]|uniref:Uncharacterized protein n=1 Tax=Granulicella aggregans TaxID=474949 RepID=A0A7W7ZEG9_9BACT|nr:hypothetical protein [Granulicella aggregans]MBB5058388.1 hypothetical protein [Granulicella aggregans]